MIYSDKILSRKLERTDTCANATFVESRARLMPEMHTKWREVKGTYVFFDWSNSPLTQTLDWVYLTKLIQKIFKLLKGFTETAMHLFSTKLALKKIKS